MERKIFLMPFDAFKGTLAFKYSNFRLGLIEYLRFRPLTRLVKKSYHTIVEFLQTMRLQCTYRFQQCANKIQQCATKFINAVIRGRV